MQQFTTSSELPDWMQFFEQEDDRPTLEHYHLAALLKELRMFRYEVGRLAGGKGGKAPSNKLSDYLIRFEKVPTATRDKKKNKKAEKTTEQLLKESRNYWNALTGIGTKQKKQITK